MYKRDIQLGVDIEKLLIAKKISTPYIEANMNLDGLTHLFESALMMLGMDLGDDSINKTPYRLKKLWKEIFYGLKPENFPSCTTIENKMGYDGMLCINNIKVRSMCEHHFVPFIGTARIAYIPEGKIMGLSKFNRIVDYFSRRPQVQERLTLQIFESLKYILGTPSVAVVIKAQHMCVHLRGVQDESSYTVTSKIGGLFQKGEVRQEFFKLVEK